MKNKHLDPTTNEFGTLVICAVRYSLGRRTYMPHVVIEYITPLLPYLDNMTLQCIDRDIAERLDMSGALGDASIDAPKWTEFHEEVRELLRGRGLLPYRTWTERINALGKGEEK